MKQLALALSLFLIINFSIFSQSEVLIIKNDKVGINTDLPTKTLDVNGDAKISGVLTVDRVVGDPQFFQFAIDTTTADVDVTTYIPAAPVAGDHLLFTNIGTKNLTNVPVVGTLLPGETCQLLRDVIGDIWHLIGAPPASILWPIGITYTQLPTKKDPNQLGLPGVWINISTEFPGDFFRVEGGAAKAFGTGQQVDAFQGHWHGGEIQDSGTFQFNGRPSSGNGAVVHYRANIVRDATNDGVNGDPRTETETRPVNQTVRIWERTK